MGGANTLFFPKVNMACTGGLGIEAVLKKEDEDDIHGNEEAREVTTASALCC